MTISFKVFAFFYFSIISWFTVATLSRFEGTYFYTLLILTIMILEGYGSLLLGSKIFKRIKIIKAPPDEIRREDDVLLQGTPFISAILFFYLTTFIDGKETKAIFGLIIALLTGTFYVLRAIAKIKSLPKYRFLSMFFLMYLALSVIFEIVILLFPTLFPDILNLAPILQVSAISSLGIIVLLPMALLGSYFPKRYGVTITFFNKRLKKS